jgi:hypothetical protein
MTTEEFAEKVSSVIVKVINGIDWFARGVIWWFIKEIIRFFKYVLSFK